MGPRLLSSERGVLLASAVCLVSGKQADSSLVVINRVAFHDRVPPAVNLAQGLDLSWMPADPEGPLPLSTGTFQHIHMQLQLKNLLHVDIQ